MAELNIYSTDLLPIVNSYADSIFNYKVRSAGDVNGDGIDDLLLFENSFGGGTSGELFAPGVHLLFGGQDFGQIDLENLLPSQGILLNDKNANDFSSAGDVNGDGYDDVIIGNDNNGILSNEGEVYLVYGGPSMNDVDLSNLTASEGITIRGGVEDSHIGFSVSDVGDINNDGYDDFIIGEPKEAGAAYLIYGGASLVDIDLSNLTTAQGIYISGFEINSLDESRISSGDLDGDGVTDLLIDNYLYFGGNFSTYLDITTLSDSISYADIAGDVNGDGVDDLILNNFVTSYLVFGSTSLASIDLSNLSPSEGITSTEELMPAGDVNNDGFDDLTTISFRTFYSDIDPNYWEQAMRVDVIYGDSSLDNITQTYIENLTLSQGFTSVRGPSVGAYDGEETGINMSVTAIGDVNGDGFDDLQIDYRTIYYSYQIYSTAYIVYGFSSALQPVSDYIETHEAIPVYGDLFADNGNGVDTHDDGAPFYVSAVEDEAGDVGNSITLDSGSLLTIHSDGTFVYLPGAATLLLREGEVFTEVIRYTISDGTESRNTTLTIDVKGLDRFTLVPDDVSGTDDTPISGNVFADNGNGPDTHVTDATLMITEVEGVTANVGTETTLSSGATILFNSNGTFTYTPTQDPVDGAIYTDSVTYTVSDGIESDTTILNIDVHGLDNDDVFLGTDTAETISGGVGDDTLYGLAGDDILIGGIGSDALYGGAGNDTASYENATSRVIVDIFVPDAGYIAGEAQGDTYASIENLTGTDFNDQLRGDYEANILIGGGGTDRLYGRRGDDIIDGGDGIDAIYGNRGADIMTGGGGHWNDRFIFFNLLELGNGAGNRDIITDFRSGAERIEISRLDADLSTPGNNAFVFIGLSAFSNTAGELRYSKSAANNYTLIQADHDGDGIADFQIELTGVMDLVATDFLL